MMGMRAIAPTTVRPLRATDQLRRQPGGGHLISSVASGGELFIGPPTEPAKSPGAWLGGSVARNIFAGLGLTDVTWTVANTSCIIEWVASTA